MFSVFRIIFFYFVLFNSWFLFSDLQDHFNKISNSGLNHKIKNIDFIYMINLDQRPEKYTLSMKYLSEYGIFPYRFSAVNGWTLTLDVLNDIGLKFTEDMEPGLWGTVYETDDLIPKDKKIEELNNIYFSHKMTLGAIGIVLSHLSILQDAWDKGYETIWVMEDDISIVKDPNILSDLVACLDQTVGRESWDLLFTDQNTKNSKGEYIKCSGLSMRPNFRPKTLEKYHKNDRINNFFYSIGARFGAYSIIYRRSGIEKLLKFFKQKKIFFPYDLDYYAPDDIQIYTVAEDVVTTQLNAPTDNGIPGYLGQKVGHVKTWNALDFAKNTSIDTETMKLLSNSEFIKMKNKYLNSIANSWCSREKANLIMDLLALTQPKICCEVGVFLGASFNAMTHVLKFLNKGTAIAVDSWSNLNAIKNLDFSDPNRQWWESVDMNYVYSTFLGNLDYFNVRKFSKIYKEDSISAAFKIGTINFLHFDGDYSEKGSMDDFNAYFNKVEKGGYILLSNIKVSIHGRIPKYSVYYKLLECCDLIVELDSKNTALFQKK